MLHDRFYSEWVQPTTLATAGSKNSVLVKLRIEKDGRVSSFEIVRPSGSSDLDESVKALANRVSRVEPLPDGLGKGDHYDVKINFEINSEEFCNGRESVRGRINLLAVIARRYSG